MTKPTLDASTLAALDVLRLALAPIYHEMGEINRRNNFVRSEHRSAEDNAQSAALWAQIDTLSKAFDAAHPIPPCPRCGAERFARIGDGVCINIGECPIAPYPGG
jgi:hypothetical protein